MSSQKRSDSRFYIHRELNRRYSEVLAVEIPLFDHFERVLHKIRRRLRPRWSAPRTPGLTRLASILVSSSLERLKPDFEILDMTVWPAEAIRARTG